VEKSVELGVHRIQLFTSEHSFIRSPKDFSGNKLERLNKIILHATQQTGRGDLMNLELPKPWPQLLENFVNRRDKIRGLLAYESLDSSQSLKTKLANLELASQQEVWLFVGSEGGFSSTEVSKAQDKGLEIVSLGSQILRVETACVVFIGSLKYELGLM
jgi:16S rRNA (uracil1498-N3)-methyltransferase